MAGRKVDVSEYYRLVRPTDGRASSRTAFRRAIPIADGGGPVEHADGFPRVSHVKRPSCAWLGCFARPDTLRGDGAIRTKTRVFTARPRAFEHIRVCRTRVGKSGAPDAWRHATRRATSGRKTRYFRTLVLCAYRARTPFRRGKSKSTFRVLPAGRKKTV